MPDISIAVYQDVGQTFFQYREGCKVGERGLTRDSLEKSIKVRRCIHFEKPHPWLLNACKPDVPNSGLDGTHLAFRGFKSLGLGV